MEWAFFVENTKIVIAGIFACLHCMTKQRGKNTTFFEKYNKQ